MIGDIAKFHPLSKLWLFVFDREMNKEEIKSITEIIHEFGSNWLAHGKPVRAAYAVSTNFLWICADTNYETTSGCSIDSLFTVIQKIEDTFKTNCKDKYWLLTSNGERYHYTELPDFSILNGKEILNVAINTLDMWLNEPFIKTEQSWLKNKLNKPVLQ